MLLFAAIAGCGPVVVEGWLVSCEIADTGACQTIAAAALNNLGRGRPAEPQGPMVVRARETCPAVPDWADPTQCWEAEIPLGAGARPACLVLARHANGIGYGQVAGDELSGIATDNPQPGCPPE